MARALLEKRCLKHSLLFYLIRLTKTHEASL